MLDVTTAETIIFDLVQPLSLQDGETVELINACGRILATPVTSNLDFPHWDNSAMDGYAVRYVDVCNCFSEETPREYREHPVTLNIIETIPAGYRPQQVLQPGTAARIFTGAVIPEGADTVVKQEVTQREGEKVHIKSAPKFGEFVRKQAAYYQAGNQLLPPGIRINSAELAVLAAAQCTQVNVFRRPKVAIFSTGDELVTPDQSLQPGQLVDSNRYALLAALQQLGVDVEILGIVPDQPEALRETMKNAIAQTDIVISSGGVSVGDYDYVEEIIHQLHGEIHIQAVAMKPGKPLTVATFTNKKPNFTHHCLYFALPGNPVSALVTFWRFVQPAILKLAGLKQDWQPQFITAKTINVLRADGRRENYLWGKLNLNQGKFEFTLAGGGHSSGNLINLAQTNALAIIPVGIKEILTGEEVMVLRI